GGRRGGGGGGRARVGGGVERDVGGHPAGPAGGRVAADAVVDRGHGGGGPLVGVAQRPPPAGQGAGAGEQQLQQHPGGEPVPGHGAADERQEHAVGVLGPGAPDVALDVGQRSGAAGGRAHVTQAPSRGAVAAQPRPLVLQQAERV